MYRQVIAPLLLAALIPPAVGAQELSEDMRRAVARANVRDGFSSGLHADARRARAPVSVAADGLPTLSSRGRASDPL